MTELSEGIIKTIMNNFGNYAPLFLFQFSLYLLWNKSNLFYYYLYGYFLSFILNFVLKGLIKEPKPFEDPKLFNIALKHSNRFKFVNGYPYDIFGMPSNHSQLAFFSTFFIFLALKDTKITIIYLFISLLTMCQRVLFKEHTALQIIAGAIVGILFGGFIYFMARQKIIGRLRKRKEDNAPI